MPAIQLLLGLMVQWLVAHAGFGLTQLALLYFLGDVASYGGDAGFWAFTPAHAWVTSDDLSGQQATSLVDLRGQFAKVTNLGDTVYGLLSFEYGFMNILDTADGLVYWAVILVHMAAWVSTLVATGAAVGFVVSSGIMQSSVGLGLVLGTGAVGGILAAIGAAN